MTNGFLSQANLVVETEVLASYTGQGGGQNWVSSAGIGGAITQYRLRYTQTYITPIPRLVTGSSSFVHQASIVVKNEPFENSTC